MNNKEPKTYEELFTELVELKKQNKHMANAKIKAEYDIESVRQTLKYAVEHKEWMQKKIDTHENDARFFAKLFLFSFVVNLIITGCSIGYYILSC